MFIPPNHLKNNFESSTANSGKVCLKSSHLLIDHELAANVFGDDLNVHAVYYPDRHTLLIAPKSDEVFKQLHKVNQHMLKGRNLRGDKTIALHEMLIDHQIDTTDRELPYDIQAGLGILNVKL